MESGHRFQQNVHGDKQQHPPAGRNVRGDFLAHIIAHKRREVIAAKERRLQAQWERVVRDLPPAHDFAAALRAGDEIAVIAEIKKASPSAGVLRQDFDPEKIATAYVRHGAKALSILTEEEFFQGSLHYLQTARSVCELPLLCKDFIVDACQVVQARAHCADAVLLITAALTNLELKQLMREVQALGMQALVEVHDQKELDAALALEANLIGVNNRDLHSFEISLQTSAQLLPLIPPGCTRVAESGIRSRAHVEYLRAFGLDAILVGTHFMRQPDPGTALAQLKGVPRSWCP